MSSIVDVKCESFEAQLSLNNSFIIQFQVIVSLSFTNIEFICERLL
jgi:hypothetical protein